MRGMRREYKIACYPRENERAIFRENEEKTEWLTAQQTWTREKSHAMRFLHKKDCESALSIIKFKKCLKTEEEYIEEKRIEKRVKQSWDEL